MPLGRFLRILLSALFALAILLIVAVEFSVVQTPENQLNYQTYEQAARELFHSAQAFVVSAIKWFGHLDAEELIALGTGVLAVATILLWLATQRILRESRRTTEKQLRAYIGVTNANAAFIDGTRPVFQVVMKNGGQTPAYDIVGRMEVLVRPLPLDKPLEFSEAVLAKRMGAIGPSGDYHMRISRDRALENDLIVAITHKECAIFVIGDVHYKDVFRRDWHTEFIVVFDEMSLDDPKHQLSAWIEGNEST